MMQKRVSLKLLCAFLLANILSSKIAWSDSNFIAARAQTISDEKINDLKWSDEIIHIHSEPSQNGETFVATIAGTYNRENWKLSKNNKSLTLNPGGGFMFEAIVTKNERAFAFEAVGPKGEVEKETIILTVPFWERSPLEPPPRRLYFSVGLGVSSISVSETGISNYSSIALTPKLNANYLLIPKVLDLGVSTYFTAFQLTKNENISAHYFGFNTRLGYILPFVTAPWAITLYGGWYFATSFIQNNSFGFRNLSGPQIYPSLKRTLPNGDVVALSFKFSPISNSLKFLSLSSREIAGGLSYIQVLKSGHTLAASFDYSNFEVILNGIDSKTNTLTLGAAYGL